jgi:hypothetical protein
LQESNPLVRQKFTLYLVLLGLSLLKDYNTPSAIRLLEKTEDEVLKAFRKAPADLHWAAFANFQNHAAEAQTIGLVRHLFVCAGGLKDFRQLDFVPQYRTIDDLNKVGILVGITGLNCCRSFDLQAITRALESRAIADEHIDALDTDDLIQGLNVWLS